MRVNIGARLNQMARIIREKKAVPMGELCLMMNLAPATIYQYARLLKNVYLDIKFENGVFESVQLDRFLELSGQRRLSEHG
jgi:predicted DNA-binding transcriptional regulator YafY